MKFCPCFYIQLFRHTTVELSYRLMIFQSTVSRFALLYEKLPFKIIFNYETKERNNTHKITSTIFTVILSVFSRICNISAELRKTARFSISIFETGDLQQIANYTIRCARNAPFRSMILHVFPTNHCSAAKK